MKKYIIVAAAAIIFCVMLVGDGLGIAAFMARHQGAHPHVSHAPMSTKVKAHTIAHDILTSIHKFVITVPASKDGNYGQFYLQVSIALETSNPRAVKDFEKLKPIIQASVIGDVMQRGPALEGNPIALKKLISASALRAANRVLAQADSKVGNSPFFGAYVTSYINQ